MIMIDANVFLAYYNKDDVHHEAAVKVAEQIVSGLYGKFFTTDYILNEVVGVTLRKFGKKRAVILGQHILTSIFVVYIGEPVLKNAWSSFSQTSLRFGLVDCSSLAVMNELGTLLIATFDKEFEKVRGIKIIK